MRNTDWIAVIAVEVLLGVSGLSHAVADEGASLPQTKPAEPPRIPKPSEVIRNSPSAREVPAVPPIPVPLPAKGLTLDSGTYWLQPPIALHPLPPQPPPGPHVVPPPPGPHVAPPTKALPASRSAIFFDQTTGMKVTHQLPDGSFDADVDLNSDSKEFKFLQGQVYRLRLKRTLPGKSVQTFYPTLEVAPATKSSALFLKYFCVPISFTDDDFAQAKSGQLVVKVIYLPDPSKQDFITIARAEEINSTQLEPGDDPIAEAQTRGEILAIIRMGNIDLENGVSPVFNGGRYYIVPQVPAPHPAER